jgi:hypothetical protein
MAKNNTTIGDGFDAFGGLANILQKNESDTVGIFGEQIKQDDDITLDENGHLSDEVLEKYRAQMLAASKKDKGDGQQEPPIDDDKNKKTIADVRKFAKTPEELFALLQLDDDEIQKKIQAGKNDDGEGAGGNTEGDGNIDSDTVIALCDVITETLGIELGDEEKPKDLEGFASIITSKLEERAKPEYANEELEALDAFVRQGGNIHDYYAAEREIDIDSLDINDSESDQKTAVRFLHRLQGIKPETSEKKIERLVSGGLLADEAKDAVDSIKETIAESKANLLKTRENEYKAALKRQSEFIDNVKNTINSTSEIYGAKLPDSDKQALMKFLFKPTAKGTTAYKEAFDANYEKNLIATAYLLMKGKTMIESAQQRGSSQAMEALKKKLLSSSIGKGSKAGASTDDSSAALQSFLRRF